MVDRCLGRAYQSSLLLVKRACIQEHGKDEGDQPQSHGYARALERQPTANASRDDENLPRRESQSFGRLFTHRNTNTCVHCFVLGAFVNGRNAQCTVGVVDSRFGSARYIAWHLVWRSNRHLAYRHDVDHRFTNSVEPCATRSYASQADVDHAFGFQRDVLLLPLWLGVVLDYQ